MKVVVSGANGFVGRAVVNYFLANTDNEVMGLQRRDEDLGFFASVVPSLSDEALLVRLLIGQDVVVHCAAAVHGRVTSSKFHHEVNVELSLSLARAAVRAGCRRFVFVSSIGVNGSHTLDCPFRETDPPQPNGPYAVSKWAAEQELMVLAAQTGLELVVVRPPLVYGWDAPGNFASLLRWIDRGWPLPLATAIANRRSYVGISNLASFLVLCAVHPLAAGEIFLVSDDEAISTAELVRNVAVAVGRRPRLWPVPLPWLQFLTRLVGRHEVAHRLFGNLEVDASKARTVLGWQPIVSMSNQLKPLITKSDDVKSI